MPPFTFNAEKLDNREPGRPNFSRAGPSSCNSAAAEIERGWKIRMPAGEYLDGSPRPVRFRLFRDGMGVDHEPASKAGSPGTDPS